jgi:hypothetical protein
VWGNYIGTNLNGSVALGNGINGVYLEYGPQYNIIGGSAAGQGNLISANVANGIKLEGSGTMTNTLSGNIIGADVTGLVSLGNGSTGVSIITGANHNLIGGNNPADGNLISSNDSTGVGISGSGSSYNLVKNNLIGADINGDPTLGNLFWGVNINSTAAFNQIGPGNLITDNNNDGIAINGAGTAGNLITQNSIYSNTLGIDLGTGAQGDIAAPTIDSITFSGGNVQFNGTACANCTVEVFANSDNDGEGETYLGSDVADGGGNFTVEVPIGDLPASFYATATNTEASDGTSEFSAPVEVQISKVYLPLVVR